MISKQYNKAMQVSRYQAGQPTWGISASQYKTIVRLIAILGGLGGMALTFVLHVDFFGGAWPTVKWGGLALGLMVSAAQFALLHRGHRDWVLLVGGVLCWGYDIAAVTSGLMVAAGDRSPFGGQISALSDAFLFVMGMVISVLSEALIAYGLLRDFWTEGKTDEQQDS